MCLAAPAYSVERRRDAAQMFDKPPGAAQPPLTKEEAHGSPTATSAASRGRGRTRSSPSARLAWRSSAPRSCTPRTQGPWRPPNRHTGRRLSRTIRSQRGCSARPLTTRFTRPRRAIRARRPMLCGISSDDIGTPRVTRGAQVSRTTLLRRERAGARPMAEGPAHGQRGKSCAQPMAAGDDQGGTARTMQYLPVVLATTRRASYPTASSCSES